MLLAIDIGNSNIVMGVSLNGDWKHLWRLQTIADRTADEYAVLFNDLFEDQGLEYDHFDSVIISSVVPRLTGTIKEIFSKRISGEPLVLTHKLDTGLELKADKPEAVGADLIADAVAAYDYYGDSCLVVDFGTATTVMAVEKPGVFRGGAICAGLKITADALVERAAQLSQIPLEMPERVIGPNTMEAMKSGLFLGHICMVEGLIDRMKKELGEVKVIATGGLAETIGAHTGYFDRIDPMLTLNGLRIIAGRAGGR